ncbi:hypothetical protein D3C76_1466540 [compost metagenome]
MRTKVVILNNTTPMGINHLFTILSWTYAIFPMVFISETPSWPTQYWNLNLLKRLNDIVTDSCRIGNR